MEEPYGEAVATRAGPELWRCVRKKFRGQSFMSLRLTHRV